MKKETQVLSQLNVTVFLSIWPLGCPHLRTLFIFLSTCLHVPWIHCPTSGTQGVWRFLQTGSFRGSLSKSVSKQPESGQLESSLTLRTCYPLLANRNIFSPIFCSLRLLRTWVAPPVWFEDCLGPFLLCHVKKTPFPLQVVCSLL